MFSKIKLFSSLKKLLWLLYYQNSYYLLLVEVAWLSNESFNSFWQSFYLKVGQKVIKWGSFSKLLFQSRVEIIISKRGKAYFKGEQLFQIGKKSYFKAGKLFQTVVQIIISKWGKLSFKVGKLFQSRVIISRWDKATVLLQCTLCSIPWCQNWRSAFMEKSNKNYLY